MEKLITICTPTYNRAHLLANLYESLKSQVSDNFKWIIVDDGSKDNTQEVVENLKKASSFEIEYYKKINGGKHTALNLGIGKADTELFFIVDSDDTLTKNATKLIEDYWNGIEKKDEFAGVAGLRGYSETKIIGTCNDEEYIDATFIDYRYNLKYEGDRAEVLRTDIMKKNKFPEFGKERFLTEAVVWNRIGSQGLKLRWFREIVTITKYLDGGLTDNYDKLMLNNFEGTKLYYKELINNEKIDSKFRNTHLSYMYLKLCEEKGCRKECLKELTNNPFKRLSYRLIYSLKERKYRK